MIISLSFLVSWIYILYNLGNKNYDLVNYEKILASSQIFTFSEIDKKELHTSSQPTDVKQGPYDFNSYQSNNIFIINVF